MSIIIERRRAKGRRETEDERRETGDGDERREEVLTFKFCPKCNCVPRWRGWREAPGVDRQSTIKQGSV